MTNALAVDLGAASTRVVHPRHGLVLDEPSVVATRDGRGRTVAVGRAAEALAAERDGVTLHRPLAAGVVGDLDAVAALLRGALRRAAAPRLRRPRLLVCVPSAGTDVERRAVRRIARRAGAGDVDLLDEPLAAAIGAGLPVAEPFGAMVVDIGAGTTAAAVTSLGGLAVRRSARVGAAAIDAAISDHLARAHGLLVDGRTAEALKRTLAPVGGAAAAPAEVRGRRLESGMAADVVVTAAELRAATAAVVGRIVEVVVAAFAACPPGLVDDVVCHGVTLAGGGAGLDGLADRITAETGVATRRSADSRNAAVNGAATMLGALAAPAHLLVHRG